MKYDHTGQTFGDWFVLRKSGKKNHWDCLCSCGKERPVFGPSLRLGVSASCGHRISERNKERLTKHGMAHSKPHHVWQNMRSRCSKPSDKAYKYYGGRGIRVCDRWHDFRNFWEDMGPSYREGLSLDRINVNGHYERSNCRWATVAEQARNKTVTTWVETPAGRMVAADAARHYGLRHSTLQNRWLLGLRGEALIAPVTRRKKIYANDLITVDTSLLVNELKRRGILNAEGAINSGELHHALSDGCMPA